MNTHKITNKKTGAELKGELLPGKPRLEDRFFFLIDGTTQVNTLIRADWDIEELPKPVELPTEPGMYVCGEFFFRRSPAGEWFLSGLFTTAFPRTEDHMRLTVKQLGPLVRLVPEITEVTDEMFQAYVEAYGGHFGGLDDSRRAGILAAIKAATRD